MSKPWPSDKLSRLRQLLAERMSAGEAGAALSKEFDHHVSKNAVIGQAKRAGFPLCSPLKRGWNCRKPSAAPELAAQKPPAKRRAAPAKATAPIPAPAPQPAPQHHWAEREPLPGAKMLTLMSLNIRSCRYGHGHPRDKEFRFCGKDTSDETSPYCHHHRKICQINRG